MKESTIQYTWQLRQRSAIDKKNRQVYARPVIRSRVDSSDIAERLVAATTLTRADIIAVLTGLSERLIDELRSGNLVTLDGIGSFQVRLKSKQVTDADGHVRLDDVHVCGVNFRPTEAFLRELQSVRPDETAGPKMTMPSDEEIMASVNEIIAESGFITSTKIIRRLKVSRRRSYQILNSLVDAGVLVRRGQGSVTHYVMAGSD